MNKPSQFPNINIIEQEASEWIVKFESDIPPNQEDVEQLQRWLSQSPKHKQVLLELASNWNEMDILASLNVAQMSEQNSFTVYVKALSLQFICFLLNIFRPPTSAIRVFAFSSVLVTLSLVIFQFSSENQAVPITYETKLGEFSKHILEDGSVLTLNTDSQAQVIYKSDKRFINLLKGEAHFVVTKDRKRPFEVHANKRIIQAIGTAFSVHRGNSTVEVLVTEGKVALFVQADEASAQRSGQSTNEKYNYEPTSIRSAPHTFVTTLVAGQSTIVNVNDEVVSVDVHNLEKSEQSRKLSWKQGKLIFAGESLQEVVREVSRHTSMTIEFNDPQLREIQIGGQFKTGETDALFEALESGFNIKVVRVGDNKVQLHAN